MLAAWIALLCLSQIVMFILTKQATQKASLPLFLCFVQFAVSAILTALVSKGRRRLLMLDWNSGLALAKLGVVWMFGFLLLNGSMAFSSAALAGVVRSLEPLANVALGVAMGETYSWKVIAALAPICTGVVLASHGGGQLSATGISLALLSNFAFSARPFLAKSLKSYDATKALDSAEVFLGVMLVAIASLPLAVILLEGRKLLAASDRLLASGEAVVYLRDVFMSGVSFFLYQYGQFKVMSQLAPLTFSVLTPTSKAVLIISCAVYFGEPFGISNLAGVGLASAGVFLFALAKSRDSQKVVSQGKKES